MGKEVVAKAKRKAEEMKEAKEAAAKKARAAITKVVMLTNLVGAGEVDEDLEEETADEAKKYGKLLRCTIKELKGKPDDQAVRIFLSFDDKASSEKCHIDMNGRLLLGAKSKHYIMMRRL